MTRLRETFARLRRQGRPALIPFVMGGDPTLRATPPLLCALAESGADVIEVGIPFSDPLADGPTIQRASSRALANGTSPAAVLAAIAQVSWRLETPLVVLSYWNLLLHYGRTGRRGDPLHAFLRAAARAGVSGLVVPDLPLEEARAYRAIAHQAGVAPIFLATPTSTADRLRQIARASEGFIYYVSLTGTTGARSRLSPQWLHGVRQLRTITTKPVCVGFGISTPIQARSIARVADGVIIGSALIQALEPYGRRPRQLVARARAFLRPFREAI